MEEVRNIVFISLLLTENIGYITARKILEELPRPEELFTADTEVFQNIQGLSRETWERLLATETRKKAEEILRKIQAENIQMLSLFDEDFPEFLKNRKELPYVLFVKGNKSLLRKRSIGVVGTRRNTYYGSKTVSLLVSGLVSEDLIVVSGLAHGIDTEAHSRALENQGKTFAVLGHGLDYVYPPGNRKLAEEILKHDGALVSEFLPHIKPERQNFPIRNRTLAGICEAVVVVESYAQGGALITAREAAKFGKKIFAVPGEIDNAASEGCHQLIYDGTAKIIPSVKHFLRELNPYSSAKARSLFEELEAKTPPENLPEKYVPVIEVFKENYNVPLHIEVLSSATKIPLNELPGILLEMEWEGLLVSLPGNLYRLA